jgi:hypothetical protein
MMTSAGARESMQLSRAAAGYCREVARPLFPEIVAVLPFTPSKTRVTLLHYLDYLLRRHFGALLLGQSVGPEFFRHEEARAANGGGGRCACHSQKVSPRQTIATGRMSKDVMH